MTEKQSGDSVIISNKVVLVFDARASRVEPREENDSSLTDDAVRDFLFYKKF